MADFMQMVAFTGNISYCDSTITPFKRGDGVDGVMMRFGVISTDRVRKPDSDGEWIDAPSERWNCVATGELAKRLVAISSTIKGTRVIVTGRVRKSAYKDKITGEVRFGSEVWVQTLGVDAVMTPADLLGKLTSALTRRRAERQAQQTADATSNMNEM